MVKIYKLNGVRLSNTVNTCSYFINCFLKISHFLINLYYSVYVVFKLSWISQRYGIYSTCSTYSKFYDLLFELFSYGYVILGLDQHW